MSNRRFFLRDILMTCAVSLLPKILQPSLPDIEEDETQVYNVQVNWHTIEHGHFHTTSYNLSLTKSEAEILNALKVL